MQKKPFARPFCPGTGLVEKTNAIFAKAPGSAVVGVFPNKGFRDGLEFRVYG